MTRLRPGSDIILTVRDLYPANQRLLSEDIDALIVLDATHPVLPKNARPSLLDAAAERPFALLSARTSEVELPRTYGLGLGALVGALAPASAT